MFLNCLTIIFVYIIIKYINILNLIIQVFESMEEIDNPLPSEENAVESIEKEEDEDLLTK